MGSADVEFTVMANKIPVFSFYTTVNFVLSVVDSFNTFNFKLSQIDIVSTTVGYNPYGQVLVETLNQYVAEGFRNYLSSGNRWMLFKKHIDLQYLFNSISHIEINDQGLTFGGEPALNPQIKKFERELRNF